jgi:thiamine biosynthesis lipoprotein
MNKKIKIIVAISLIAALLALTGCGELKAEKKSQFMLNTNCTIIVYDKNATKILDDAFALGVSYENLFSSTIEGSDIYKINHAGGGPVAVSDATIEILKDAIHFSEISDGLFDVTMGKLTSLWDFPGAAHIVPSADVIAADLKTVGYKDIKIDGNTVTLLRPGAELDLGAIGKGFIADRLADYLKAQKVQGAIVNLGGNVITIGEKPKIKTWIVGIQQPFADRNETVATVTVGEKSVVTSGIYERSFTAADGKFYHHILDPRTGYPVENTLSAVSIISDLSVDGDGLSTTCFLLGMEKATALIESLPNTEAIFITKDNQIFMTSGLGKDIPYQLVTAQ